MSQPIEVSVVAEQLCSLHVAFRISMLFASSGFLSELCLAYAEAPSRSVSSPFHSDYHAHVWWNYLIILITKKVKLLQCYQFLLWIAGTGFRLVTRTMTAIMNSSLDKIYFRYLLC